MTGALETTFQVLIAVTVLTAALAIGLRITAHEIVDAVRRFSLVVVIAVNLALVPLAGVLIVELIPVSEAARTGILLCAICAGGPLSLKTGQIARGDLKWTLGLTVILLASNIVTVPLWTGLVMEQSIPVDPVPLAATLILLVVLPVAAGMLVRKRRPEAAGSWIPRLDLASNILLVTVVAVGLVVAAGELGSALRSWTMVAIGLVLLTSALGASVVPGSAATRRINVLITINRATSVALLIVGAWFVDQPEVLASVIVFGIVQTAVALTAATAMRQTARSAAMPA